MVHSDSEGETIDDLEFDGTTDGEGEEDNDNEIDEALLGALEAGVDDVTEADDVRARAYIYFAEFMFAFSSRSRVQRTRTRKTMRKSPSRLWNQRSTRL